MRIIFVFLCILGVFALSKSIKRKQAQKGTKQSRQVVHAPSKKAGFPAQERKTVVDNNESSKSTYKIGLAVSVKSSADNKKPVVQNYRRELFADEKHFLENAAKELECSINNLKPYNQIDLSPPSDEDEVVYLPIEGTFNKRFFTRLYLLRNHVIANEIISAFDMVQYQIPVKANNTELILLIYGEHLFKNINTPQEELKKPIGESMCLNTDEIIKKSCPVVGIPFGVWAYRDEGDRRTAVLISSEFKRFGEQTWRLNEWIDENFKLAADEYSHSIWNMVKWVKEYKLFNLVRFWFPDAIFQYSPNWLAGQSIDMFVPSLNTGIEYQGKQHYEAVDYFGGEEKLQENTIRDKTKAILCEKNGVVLTSWPYTKKVTFSAVMEYFGNDISNAEKILNQFVPMPALDVLLKRETHAQTARKEKREEKAEKHTQSIIRAYDKKGTLIGEYTSIMQASEAVGISSASIQKCLAGERKTAADYIWIRENWGSEPCSKESMAQLIESISRSAEDGDTLGISAGVGKAVMQIDPSTGEVVEVHKSIASAAKAVGISSKGIQDVLKYKQKTAGGYYWQLVEKRNEN